MPWINHERYVHFLQALERVYMQSCTIADLKNQIEDLKNQIANERIRAENAIDALLLHQGAVPITPQPPAKPEQPMFEDDPEELERMMRDYQQSPIETLLSQGRGDAQ